MDHQVICLWAIFICLGIEISLLTSITLTLVQFDLFKSISLFNEFSKSSLVLSEVRVLDDLLLSGVQKSHL